MALRTECERVTTLKSECFNLTVTVLQDKPSLAIPAATSAHKCRRVLIKTLLSPSSRKVLSVLIDLRRAPVSLSSWASRRAGATPRQRSINHSERKAEKTRTKSALEVRREPIVSMPRAWSIFSVTLPTPPSLRTGLGCSHASNDSRSRGTRNCPLGLSSSAAIFASAKFGAMPALAVKPFVLSRILARNSSTSSTAARASASTSPSSTGACTLKSSTTPTPTPASALSPADAAATDSAARARTLSVMST
mmetsp:Transcript_80618/g.233097  ORF Transcript_80618/g.233097 Transcript_80618/m.233097 type:complete len:250 (-) Transcript_80618:782-1531(-)